MLTHVTHFGTREGLSYYKMTAPNDRVPHLRYLGIALDQICWSSPGVHSGAQKTNNCEFTIYSYGVPTMVIDGASVLT